jgi:leader peptidase (prepilin peptidase)/N-methyltransferase
MDRFAIANLMLHVIVILMGAGIGSFLNVVIYRLPLGMSVDKPRRSFCPSCKKMIPWYQNIPLLSWLLLRGKCSSCKATISVRYFLVELLVAVLFYAVFRVFGGDWIDLKVWGPQVLAYWILLSLLVAGTFIDLEHFILPHEITGFGTIAGLLCALWVPALVEQETHLMGLTISFLSASMGLGLIWTVLEMGKLLFGRLNFRQRPASVEKLRSGLGRGFLGKMVDDLLGMILGSKWIDRPASWSIYEPSADDPPVFKFNAGTKEEEAVIYPWDHIFSRDRDHLTLDCETVTVNDRTWSKVVVDATMDVLTIRQNSADKTGEKVAWETVKRLEGTLTSFVLPREAMGMGDMFFMALIGSFLGWKGVLFTVMAGSFIGAIFGAVPRIIGRASWTANIPFGPYLAAGAGLYLFYGPQWIERYLEWSHVGGR